MKKNIFKNIIIVFLLILVVFLLTFIICNKFIEKGKDNNYNENNENNNNSNIIAGIEEFPTENSDDILLYGDLFYDLLNEEQREKVSKWKNFGTVTLNINNIPITYKCNFEEYQEYPENSRCVTVDINFDNHNLTSINGLGEGLSDEIIYTENYLIYRVYSGATEQGNIYVYDKKHNLLTTINNVSASYKDSNGKYVYDSFRLVDNVLYFISGSIIANEIYLSYVDLNDNTYTVHNIEKID